MSEQTSPLHDPAATPVATTGRAAPRISFDAITSDWARAITIALLAGVLILAGYLRLTHNNWDASTGPWDNSDAPTTSGHLHPDERFLTQISEDTKAPSS